MTNSDHRADEIDDAMRHERREKKQERRSHEITADHTRIGELR